MLGRTADALVARFGWRRGLRLAAQMRLARLRPAGAPVRADVPLFAAPVHLRARTSDLAVLRELLAEPAFDDVAALDPAFIVDAGANIGLVSALLATRCPRARIVALEIDPANFAMLERNTRAYGNVTPLLAGLWSHEAGLGVANPEAAAWGYRAEERGDDSPDVVRGYGVHDLMRRFGVDRVDVLKVDIEGGEREVFGDDAERWLPRVGVIVIELHDRLVSGCSDAVHERLRGRFTRTRSGTLEVFVRSDLAAS